MALSAEFDSRTDRIAYAVVSLGAAALSYDHARTFFLPFMGAVGASVTPLMLDAVVYWLATASIRQARNGRPLPMLRIGAYALLSLSITANALGGATLPERLFMALPAALFGYLTEVQIRLALYEHRAARGDSDRLGLLLWLRHPVRSIRAKLWQARRRAAAFDAAAAERDRLAAARDAVRLASWGRVSDNVSWYDFCVSYVDMKWSDASAHHRANIAWTLVTVMPAMLTTDRGKPDGIAMRTALRKWGFNTKQRADCPDDAAAILTWFSRSTKPVAALADPTIMRAVLTAAGTLLDGTPAAPSTIRRNRTILHNELEYAVERRLLTGNPVKAIKWKAPKTAHEIDRRSVVNHAQARRLLGAVRKQVPSGPRLMAFFAVIYYTALRPEEAVNLRRENITLPPMAWNEATSQWEDPADNWGELRFCSAATEIGAEWTDAGTRREHRHLKARAQGEWRRVPIPPPFTRILRAHLDEFGTGRDGRVFSGIRGGELASVTYRRTWDSARRAALTPAEYASPLARRVYDLRHACVSTWLNGGVPPVQVAEWAGHSVAVLLRVYAKCIDGQDQVAKRRIEEALGESNDD